MTFFHFINCLTLAYAPYFIVYKYSGINEYCSIWKCAQAGVGYLLTQLAKLLILATFFPAYDFEGFAFLPEFLKSSADIMDVIGLHFIMTNLLTGKGEIRFIAGSLGWGFAHSVSHRIILFWTQARGSAFSWLWIQSALDSSIDMILILSTAALTWMITRTNQRALVGTFLALAVYHVFIYQFIQNSLHITGWSFVAVRFLFSATIAAGTTFAYAVHGNTKKVD